MDQSFSRRFCVAPMMDWTDRHERYFLRLISRHAWLYTEMVTTGALLRGDAARHLAFDEREHPVALQLGGADPHALACSARMAEDKGYDEVNLNVGCPSDRVQTGRFGACLMAEPELVGDCVAAMRAAVRLPVTVKTRIGIDAQDSYESLAHFVRTVARAGCETFIIHARKAWLKGLSPKENREVPPLRYDVVYRLGQDFPGLEIVLNGGITTLQQAADHLRQVDGVMLGREVYHNPYILAGVDRLLYGDDAPAPSRHAVLEQFLPYAERMAAAGVPLTSMTRHVLGLFHGIPGARTFRRALSGSGCGGATAAALLREAVRQLPPAA
ncbi:MAG: tRNA dihydrouridine(20/20a) synthase DusA [Betaproteobacteria bacterium]|nr:tRNA dihydrouridine(20/20a) synthase DusA [Betaproteobacteria bacterium]